MLGIISKPGAKLIINQFGTIIRNVDPTVLTTQLMMMRLEIDGATL
jgi:hypothetical protein